MVLGFRRARLDSGSGDAPPVVASGDRVAPPPAFGRRLGYPELGWNLRHDRRDSLGRTFHGTLVELELYATRDVDDATTSAARASLSTALFVPLAPRHRVLVLAAGAAAATPWTESDEVPLHALVSLGRNTYLRGYSKRRFRDVAGWWGSVEYRYPIFDFKDSGAGLSSTLFFDVGRVGDGADELTRAPIRYSYGFGARGVTEDGFVLRAQVGLSPEGLEAFVSLNDLP